MTKSDPFGELLEQRQRELRSALFEYEEPIKRAIDALQASQDHLEAYQVLKDPKALRKEISAAADVFEAAKNALKQASTEFDRQPVIAANKTAKRLFMQLKNIRGTWHQSINNNQRMISDQHPNLIHKLEDSIKSFTASCERALERNPIKLKRSGRRLRPDVEIAAKQLSESWILLSGQRFTYNYTSAEGRNDIPQFVSPGLLFVQLVLQAFDSTITIANIETALEGKRSQKS